MVGLVIATHGHLAAELISTAENIVGPLAQTAVCEVVSGSAPEAIKKAIQQAVASVDTGEGVIVLSDLMGGTPCNQSLQLCQEKNLEVLTGVNLPMVLKANALRTQAGSLSDMATAIVQHGQKHINRVSLHVKASP